MYRGRAAEAGFCFEAGNVTPMAKSPEEAFIESLEAAGEQPERSESDETHQIDVDFPLTDDAGDGDDGAPAQAPAIDSEKQARARRNSELMKEAYSSTKAIGVAAPDAPRSTRFLTLAERLLGR